MKILTPNRVVQKTLRATSSGTKVRTIVALVPAEKESTDYNFVI